MPTYVYNDMWQHVFGFIYGQRLLKWQPDGWDQEIFLTALLKQYCYGGDSICYDGGIF